MNRVLVVSPDPALRGFVRMALGRDWEFAEARNGHEALARAAEWHPHLVVAHEIAENFGAFGLTRELKVDATPPRVLVLLERPHDQWLAKWSGADRWIILPADPFELAEVAREIVDAPPVSADAPGSVPPDPVAAPGIAAGG